MASPWTLPSSVQGSEKVETRAGGGKTEVATGHSSVAFSGTLCPTLVLIRQDLPLGTAVLMGSFAIEAVARV